MSYKTSYPDGSLKLRSSGNGTEYAPRVILSRVQATEVFLYQDLSVGVSALLMGGGSSPELQADLHVKGRCSQEAVGPTCSEMTRVKGCQWDAQSLNWNLLSDEVLTRLLPDYMYCLGKLRWCMSYSVPAPGVWLRT